MLSSNGIALGCMFSFTNKLSIQVIMGHKNKYDNMDIPTYNKSLLVFGLDIIGLSLFLLKYIKVKIKPMFIAIEFNK